MTSLLELLIAILLAIGFIILATNKFRLHPFLALIIGSLFVGFLSGIHPETVIQLITKGFGGILSGIGIIVVLGTVIGVFVERSGALDVVADRVIRLFGSKHLVSSISFLGAVVSIPVFCDSGFIILSRLMKKLARLNGMSSFPLSLSLGAGLYTTHTLIPPTPGPIAVAGNLEISDQLGLVILTGILVSIPVLIVSTIYSKRLSKSLTVDELEFEQEVVSSETKEVHIFWAILPILIPILLITVASALRILEVDGALVRVLFFLGNPTMALLIGCILSMLQVQSSSSMEEIGELFKKGIAQAGPIILITGAGGAFGNVLKGTDLGGLLAEQLGETIDSIPIPILIFISFAIAALLKTAQGSSTSALVIASAMVAPILIGQESVTAFQMTLIVMSFGGGAMTVSHANDSYFWVVTQFSEMTTNQGYRWYTLLTLLQGVTVLVSVLGLYYLSLISW